MSIPSYLPNSKRQSLKEQLLIVSKEPVLPKICVADEILSWLKWKNFMLACSRGVSGLATLLQRYDIVISISLCLKASIHSQKKKKKALISLLYPSRNLI